MNSIDSTDRDCLVEEILKLRKENETLKSDQLKNIPSDRQVRAKYFEIRDRATFIPALALEITPDQYLARRCGYNESKIALYQLNDSKCYSDPHLWGAILNRTMTTAHLYIEKHFDELKNGDVIDVEFILGETKEKKTSEEIFAEKHDEIYMHGKSEYSLGIRKR